MIALVVPSQNIKNPMLIQVEKACEDLNKCKSSYTEWQQKFIKVLSDVLIMNVDINEGQIYYLFTTLGQVLNPMLWINLCEDTMVLFCDGLNHFLLKY
jgi:hypothetical protein